MQSFKGVASGKQSFREHCATKWFLEANPRNISASKISRYTVFKVIRTVFNAVNKAAIVDCSALIAQQQNHNR